MPSDEQEQRYPGIKSAMIPVSGGGSMIQAWGAEDSLRSVELALGIVDRFESPEALLEILSALGILKLNVDAIEEHGEKVKPHFLTDPNWERLRTAMARMKNGAKEG